MKNVILVLLLSAAALANTPGKAQVSLSWSDLDAGVTFNIYRGSVAGVCSGTPTPLVAGVTSLSFVDSTVTAGSAYVYAVSAVKGVESACSNEVQIAVPSAPKAPNGLQGTSP